MRGPLGQKQPKPEKNKRKWMRQISKKRADYRKSDAGQADLARMVKVRRLPCCICVKFGTVQTSKTEAHHCKSGRFSSAREDDINTIPLCMCHHQGLRFDRDKSKIAYHQGQETWEAAYGPDFGYLEDTNSMIDMLGGDY